MFFNFFPNVYYNYDFKYPSIWHRMIWLWLGKSSFLVLEYSVEPLVNSTVEYSNARQGVRHVRWFCNYCTEQ